MIKLQKFHRYLSQVESFVQTQPQHPYFLNHKRRYICDLKILSTVYNGGKILEVGSFPYHFTALLKIINLPVTGVDLLPNRCEQMIKKFELNIVKCDIEKEPLPFIDSSFKYLIFSEVFEHLRYDPLYTLSQLNRVLSDDGWLILTTPNLYAIQKIVKFLLGYGYCDPVREFAKLRNGGHMGHIREYSHKDVKKFLDTANFIVKRVWYKHYHYPFTIKGVVGYFLLHILPPFFRSYQVVLAKKAGKHVDMDPL